MESCRRNEGRDGDNRQSEIKSAVKELHCVKFLIYRSVYQPDNLQTRRILQPRLTKTKNRQSRPLFIRHQGEMCALLFLCRKAQAMGKRRVELCRRGGAQNPRFSAPRRTWHMFYVDGKEMRLQLCHRPKKGLERDWISRIDTSSKYVITK